MQSALNDPGGCQGYNITAVGYASRCHDTAPTCRPGAVHPRRPARASWQLQLQIGMRGVREGQVQYLRVHTERLFLCRGKSLSGSMQNQGSLDNWRPPGHFPTWPEFEVGQFFRLKDASHSVVAQQ